VTFGIVALIFAVGLIFWNLESRDKKARAAAGFTEIPKSSFALPSKASECEALFQCKERFEKAKAHQTSIERRTVECLEEVEPLANAYSFILKDEYKPPTTAGGPFFELELYSAYEEYRFMRERLCRHEARFYNKYKEWPEGYEPVSSLCERLLGYYGYNQDDLLLKDKR